MATTTSTVPTYLTTLCARLNARFAADTDLAEVRAYAAPPGDPYPLEALEIFGTDDTQAWGALGNRRRTESYTVRGMIGIVRAGSGDDTAEAARARAYAILAVLEDDIRTDPNCGGTVLRSNLASANLTQGYAEEGRWAALEIRIDVYAELISN